MDLANKLAVITGANSGIGLEACVHLAKRGCEIVMCCRSVDKAEKAKTEIVQRSGLSDGLKIHIVQLDLMDLDNIEGFRSRYDSNSAIAGRPIDILILNAGIMAPPKRELTKQGLEAQMGTNVVGHFKFLGSVYDLCKIATHSRIVFVSSLMHNFTSGIDFKDFNHDRYKSWPVYCQSKLGDLLLMFKLNRLLEKKGVTNVVAVACHPGYSATNLMSHTAAAYFNFLVAQSATSGALPTVLAATDPNPPKNGYAGPRVFETWGAAKWGQHVNSVARKQEQQDQLWAKCEEFTKCNLEEKL